MERVGSKEGTTVAFDRLGNGPTVIVVGGATCDRATTRPLAEQLAQRFTLINFDRRARRDSGDTAPYAVEREIEDLGALIAVAGAPRRCTAIQMKGVLCGDVGFLESEMTRPCTTRSTKGFEIEFRALLTEGTIKVKLAMP